MAARFWASKHVQDRHWAPGPCSTCLPLPCCCSCRAPACGPANSATPASWLHPSSQRPALEWWQARWNDIARPVAPLPDGDPRGSHARGVRRPAASRQGGSWHMENVGEQADRPGICRYPRFPSGLITSLTTVMTKRVAQIA